MEIIWQSFPLQVVCVDGNLTSRTANSFRDVNQKISLKRYSLLSLEKSSFPHSFVHSICGHLLYARRCAKSGVANSGCQANSRVPPVSVNKVFLDHNQAHSLIYCLWLLLCLWQSENSCYRKCVAWWRPKYFLIWFFTELVGRLWC